MVGKNSMKHHHLKKKIFMFYLNMEDITDAGSAHTKEGYKDFEMKNLGDYHDLYFQSDTFLLADIFEKFPNICLEMYDLILQSVF